LKKIRVVHIVYSFGTGGLEKGIATLINNAPSDIEHIILCLSKSGMSSRLVPEQTQIIEMNKQPGNSFRFIWKLSRTLKLLMPDIVHTRNWSGIDGIIAAKIAGISNVIHGEHGWEIQDPSGLNPKRVFIRRAFSALVKEYTCVSRHLESWLKHTIKVKKPVTQIYNGINVSTFLKSTTNSIVRKELNIPKDTFIIGVVGRLDPIKDHSTLFRAFEIVCAKKENCCLLVIGDGNERNRLKKMAGKGVVFLGNRTDVPELMMALDLFVLPSKNEGISNTILEALSAGLPVIATNVGGNPELVDDGHAGLLFQPGDFIGLASKILKYVDNKELRFRHGDAGRKKMIDQFKIKHMCYSYHRIYRRLS
jgi:sugar transferase (PEP-CTERM/EpsH1 system associated)